MSYRKVVWAFFLFMLGPYVQAKAQGRANTAKLDSLFTLIENDQQGMGSLSIWKDGKQVYSKGFGYANMQNQMPNSQSTKYRIGSITKTFTAAIIMQLIEEGKILLDTRLSRFYPQIPNADKITIEHLLRHRSGLFNYVAANDFYTWDRESISEDKLIEKFVAYGTVLEPDELSHYSNTNYILLSFIAEKIDKKAFFHILQERITGPLALPHTYYGGAINPAKGEAFAYSLALNWEQAPQTHISLMGGAGGLFLIRKT